MPAHQVGDRRRRAFFRYVQERHLGFLGQQRDGHVRHAADARRREIDLPALAGIGDEFPGVLGRILRIDHQHLRRVHDQRYGREILHVVGQLGIQRRIDGDGARGGDPQRPAVRRLVQSILRGDRPVAARAVFHHDILLQFLAELLADHPLAIRSDGPPAGKATTRRT